MLHKSDVIENIDTFLCVDCYSKYQTVNFFHNVVHCCTRTELIFSTSNYIPVHVERYQIAMARTKSQDHSNFQINLRTEKLFKLLQASLKGINL